MALFKPRPYQSYNIERMKTEPYFGAFLDMGLGKTVITLSAIEWLAYHDMSINKVLIVAPKTVVQGTWQDECNKWDHTCKIKIVEVLGSAKQRVAALNKKAIVYAINYENLVWLCCHYNHALDKVFDMIVFDESTNMKGYDSKRFKVFKRAAEYVPRIVLLTGTPAPRDYADLWAQLYLLDRGERLGKNITTFRNTYFASQHKGQYREYSLLPGADKIIQDKIKDICVSMNANDYLGDQPSILYIDKKVVLSDKTYKAYKSFEKEKVLEIADKMGMRTDDDIDSIPPLVLASNAAALRMKLLQFAQGAVYLGDDEMGNHRDGYAVYHDEKLNYLVDVVSSAKGKPVLIVYQFKHDLERITAALCKEGYSPRQYKTPQDKKDWNNGKIDALLVHPASAGYGLNLQFGGSIIIWYCLTNKLGDYLQMNTRIWRSGQAEVVRCIHILCAGTEDEKVMANIYRKDMSQKELLNSLKAKLNEYVL